MYEGYAGAFASFFQTADPNAHKLTNVSQPGVPELKSTEEEFVIVDRGFDDSILAQLEKRCEFWRKKGKMIPI